MKNNAIMFMIDSVVWETVGTNRCKVSPTPFMDSLKREGLWTNNLYSHGPYTDAATRSLYTGRNTLDDMGYFFKLNCSPTNQYKLFKEAGYETLSYYYPYYMMGNNVTKYIDKLYYKTGFEYRSEWGGIFAYYCDIRKTRKLNEIELQMLKQRMELMFEVWLKFYKDLETKQEASENLKDLLDMSSVANDKKTLEKEFQKFTENYDEYIEDFLAKGLDHTLAHIPYININDRTQKEYLDAVVKRHPAFFKQVERSNIKANIFSSMPSPKRIFHAIKQYCKDKNMNDFAFFENYLIGMAHFKAVQTHWGSERWQHMPSSRFMLRFVADNILRNRKSDKPFFLCTNLEEVHHELAFFTYDIKDEKMIDYEISVLQEFADQLGEDYKGSLVYYLGLRYLDLCIEEFCSKLKEMGLWDNTTILFTADHGSSYTFYPVHNQRVNNFHDECYHIPVLMRHPGMKPTEINTYQYSKDVLPTFMDILGLELSPYFKGESMIRDSEPRKYVMHEYMGPGCPDIMQRPIWFSIRDEKYVVAYKVKLFDCFENGELCEVYDKTSDPKEYYNIASSINTGEIQYLLDAICARHSELKNDTESFYAKLVLQEHGIPIND